MVLRNLFRTPDAYYVIMSFARAGERGLACGTHDHMLSLLADETRSAGKGVDGAMQSDSIAAQSLARKSCGNTSGKSSRCQKDFLASWKPFKGTAAQKEISFGLPEKCLSQDALQSCHRKGLNLILSHSFRLHCFLAMVAMETKTW